jgi:NMD protein affecting ribosome stability and mRNA decay
MGYCCKCGEEIPDDMVSACTVNHDEQRQFPEHLTIGELICAVCFHEIKWPHLTHTEPELEGLDDTTEAELDL